MAFIKLLLNGDNANMYKLKVLDKYYNLSYKDLRRRPLYNYYAIAITLAVIAVYIRCIYRVVELAQGFSGYLITHEVYNDIGCSNDWYLLYNLHTFPSTSCNGIK